MDVAHMSVCMEADMNTQPLLHRVFRRAKKSAAKCLQGQVVPFLLPLGMLGVIDRRKIHVILGSASIASSQGCAE